MSMQRPSNPNTSILTAAGGPIDQMLPSRLAWLRDGTALTLSWHQTVLKDE